MRISQIYKKVIFGLAFLQIIACSFFDKKPPQVNTEVICPNGSAILIKFARSRDLRLAIRAAYLNKRKQRTSENYTPIRLSDGRSFVIKNLSPEVASTCNLYESKIGEVEKTYIHRF